MIELQVRETGILLPVKAQPGARRNAILGTHAGSLKVSVHAAPENGKATAAIIELLSTELGIARSNIQLLTGATSRQKLFLISGVNRAELEERIQTILGPQAK